MVSWPLTNMNMRIRWIEWQQLAFRCVQFVCFVFVNGSLKIIILVSLELERFEKVWKGSFWSFWQKIQKSFFRTAMLPVKKWQTYSFPLKKIKRKKVQKWNIKPGFFRRVKDEWHHTPGDLIPCLKKKSNIFTNHRIQYSQITNTYASPTTFCLGCSSSKTAVFKSL